MEKISDTWNSSDQYEYFMGRWSDLMAPVFLRWLSFPSQRSWMDVGCGTGALSAAICRDYEPANLTCIDPSAEFLEKARARLSDGCEFIAGSASGIPKADDAFDIVVSGLALNFFPDLPAAFYEMKRVVKPGGTIAPYVWDYTNGMQFLRLFWDAAREVSPEAAKLDEGVRFPICNKDALKDAFQKAGLADIKTSYLEIDTIFSSFEDYWQPFLGGQGPAPSYLASLPPDLRGKLRENVLNKLPIEPDGSIRLLARAIAVRGRLAF